MAGEGFYILQSAEANLNVVSGQEQHQDSEQSLPKRIESSDMASATVSVPVNGAESKPNHIGRENDRNARWCRYCDTLTSFSNLKMHLSRTHFAQDLLNRSGSSVKQCGICRRKFGEGKDTSVQRKLTTYHLAYHHHLLGRDQDGNWVAQDGHTRSTLPRATPPMMPPKMTPYQPQRRLPCSLCPGGFKSMRTFKMHFAQIHFAKDLLAKSKSSSDECGICGKQFREPGKPKYAIESQMSWHLAFHHGLLKQLKDEESWLRDSGENEETKPAATISPARPSEPVAQCQSEQSQGTAMISPTISSEPVAICQAEQSQGTVVEAPNVAAGHEDLVVTPVQSQGTAVGVPNVAVGQEDLVVTTVQENAFPTENGHVTQNPGNNSGSAGMVLRVLSHDMLQWRSFESVANANQSYQVTPMDVFNNERPRTRQQLPFPPSVRIDNQDVRGCQPGCPAGN